jgi:hypothetical protein
VAIRRRPGRPRTVVRLPLRNRQTLYAVTLTAPPSRAWRAAFLRPPPALTRGRFTPELGRLGLDEATVLFRTTPAQLAPWLRRIDRWVAYANSIVAE